jgi:predicted membrane protein
MGASPYQSGPRGALLGPQLFVGLIVMAVGLLLTLDNLQLLEAERYLRFWPALLVLAGLARIVHAAARNRGSFGGFILLSAGAWFLLQEADVVRVSVRDVWPAVLVAIGGFLVWQAVAVPRVEAGGDANATVNAMAVLGSVARGNNAAAFRGGQLTAVMGGCELDLRHAAIDGEATLEVFALWGGIEIRVPEDWTVVLRVTPVLGGVDDQTRPSKSASRHRLVLRGMVMMAGVEIKN